MTAPAQRVNHRVTFAVVAIGVMTYAMLQSLIIPVLPLVQRDLHTTESAATWALTGNLLSAAVFTPIIGRLGDVYGKKKMFILALLSLAVGSLLAAVAGSIGVLLVARVIQGVGGGTLPLSFGLVRDEFPPERVMGAIGSIATVTAFGGAMGTAAAGQVVEHLDLHWLFWIPMILTTLAAVATALFVAESPIRAAARIPVWPAVLMSAWLVALLVAVGEAPKWGWGSPRVLLLIAAAIALAVAWIRSESNAEAPMVDMRMMRMTSVWTTNLSAFMVGWGMYASFAFIPRLMQAPRSTGYGLGQSVTVAALVLLPSGLATFFVGQWSGALSRRFGSKLLIVTGGVVAATSMFLVASLHDQATPMYIWTTLMGTGIGLSYAALAAVIVAVVPPEQTGVAAGMNANIRTVGGAIGSGVMASIVISWPDETGYATGFVMLGAVFMASAGAGLLIPMNKHAIPAGAAPHAGLAIVAGGTVAGYQSE